MISKFNLALALALGAASLSSAAIIGTDTPAQPVTAERITGLPWRQRHSWNEYLKRSARQLQADQQFIRNELQQHGLKEATNGPPARSVRGIALGQTADW